ncbi:MAG: hypothetical protein AMXMBFR23_11260 [Chloroflexota bacterium]
MPPRMILGCLVLVAVLIAGCEGEGDVIVGGSMPGTVGGRVTVDGVGAPGVTVTLSNGRTFTTGANGDYLADQVPEGAYTVAISGFPADVAFPTTVQAAVVAVPGQHVTVNFSGARIRTGAARTPTPTPAATSAVSPPDPFWGDLLAGGEAVDGMMHTITRDEVMVFVLDGVPFGIGGLQVVEAHEPFCSYQHVHGGPVRSIVPGPDGKHVERTEHLRECGYGEPNFWVIPDPR